jgi:hypothetical protein
MPALLGMQINQVMLLFGVGLIVLVMINRVRRGFGQSGSQARSARAWRSDRRSTATIIGSREAIGSARVRSATASPEHESWEVDMHRLAREIKAEIDSKMQALTQLIQMADEARSMLDASLARAQSHDYGSTNDYRIDHPGRGLAHARGVASKRATVSSATVRSGDSHSDDSRFERVYALADAGFSAARIASQIGSQIGEVELILSLRAI